MFGNIFATLITFLHRAISMGILLLFGSTGEIITEKSGNLNLGIPGIMYIGGMSGVIGAFFYENSLTDKADANGFLAIFIPLISCILGSLIAGMIYSFLTVTLKANQNVTGLALTTFGTGFGNFFGGSLIKLTGADVPSVALSTTSAYFSKTLPVAEKTGWFGKLFFELRLFGISCNHHCSCLCICAQQNKSRLASPCSGRKPCNCRCGRH